MVVYVQQQQQQSAGSGGEGAKAGNLSAFIRNTVTIHTLIIDRIDRLRPSQQLTLKARARAPSTDSLRMLMLAHPCSTS